MDRPSQTLLYLVNYPPSVTPTHLLLAEEGSQLPRHRKAVVWGPTATSRFHTQAALGLAVRSPDQSSQRQQTEKEALTSKTMNPPTLFPVPTAPHIPNLNSDSKGQRVSVTHTASFQPWSCTPPWKGSLTTKTWWPEVGAGSRYDVKNPGRKAFAFTTPGVQGAGLVLRNPRVHTGDCGSWDSGLGKGFPWPRRQRQGRETGARSLPRGSGKGSPALG